MEVELHDHQTNNISRNSEETEPSELDHVVGNGDSRHKRRAKKASNHDSVIDINDGSGSKEETVCRICHFASDHEESSGGSELIPLGCDCRGELGGAHYNCAEMWFLQKGNRLCEICGKMAKNIMKKVEDEDGSISMLECNEMRVIAASLESYDENRHCKKSLCNFLLACLILAFVLPWFFRPTKMS